MITPWKRAARALITRRCERDAFRALEAAAAGDCSTGHDITALATARYGFAAAYPMAVVWCGAVLPDSGYPGHPQGGRTVELRFLSPEGVPAENADVPAPVRWTGQVLAARAVGDRDMFDALLAALPSDAYESQSHLAALLHAAAASVLGRVRA